MMRMPGAVWIGPTVNEGDGDGHPGEAADAMSTVVGVVLHIQQGSEAGTEAWQRNPRARVSSHFLAPKAGGIRQMVDTADRAWCEVDGNRHWLSIECEGLSGQQLTGAQVEACARVLAFAHQNYRVPVAISNAWAATRVQDGGLGYHAMGGNAWGGHFDCPGSPIVNQRPAIVARALQILGGDMDPTRAREIDTTNYAVTQIPDLDNPQAPRRPLQVVEAEQTQLLHKILDQNTALIALVQQLVGTRPTG